MVLIGRGEGGGMGTCGPCWSALSAPRADTTAGRKEQCATRLALCPFPHSGTPQFDSTSPFYKIVPDLLLFFVVLWSPPRPFSFPFHDGVSVSTSRLVCTFRFSICRDRFYNFFFLREREGTVSQQSKLHKFSPAHQDPGNCEHIV